MRRCGHRLPGYAHAEHPLAFLGARGFIGGGAHGSGRGVLGDGHCICRHTSTETRTRPRPSVRHSRTRRNGNSTGIQRKWCMAVQESLLNLNSVLVLWYSHLDIGTVHGANTIWLRSLGVPWAVWISFMLGLVAPTSFYQTHTHQCESRSQSILILAPCSGHFRCRILVAMDVSHDDPTLPAPSTKSAPTGTLLTRKDTSPAPAGVGRPFQVLARRPSLQAAR